MSFDNLDAKAAALAERLPVVALHPEAVQGMRGFCSDTKWALALSGGADSVALLLLIWAHWPQRRGQLVALHYNHCLRGAAADADAAFCRELCARLEVELIAGQRPDGLELRSEEQARAARFEFFAREMAGMGARVLLLGHQQNDVAETLLMRLARGSGPRGLAAPRPVQPLGISAERPRERVHLRPLLSLQRAQIEAALRDCQIPWREDATNAQGDFFRNRVRLDVLPALARAAAGPRDVVAGLGLARELIAEDDAALEAWAQAVYRAMPPGTLDLRALKGLPGRAARAQDAPTASGAAAPAYLAPVPRAVLRRVLHYWLRDCTGEAALSRAAFDSLLAAAEAARSTRLSLGAQGFALIRKGLLRYEPSP